MQLGLGTLRIQTHKQSMVSSYNAPQGFHVLHRLIAKTQDVHHVADQLEALAMIWQEVCWLQHLGNEASQHVSHQNTSEAKA